MSPERMVAMDLFEMFGVEDVPAPAPKKKEVKKKPEKKKEKKTEKSVPTTFNCPLSVITDFGEVKISEDGTKTERELIDILAAKFVVPAEKCVLQEKGKNLFFSVNREKVSAKGEIELGPDTVLYVGERQEIDISGLLTSDQPESVPFGKLGTYLADMASPLFSIVTAFPSSENEVTVIPAVMEQKDLEMELSKMKFPFRIGQVDGNVSEIPEDYYESVLKEAGKDASGEKEAGLLYEDVKEFIKKQYPQFRGEAVFNACSDKNAILIFVDAKEKRVSSSAAQSKTLIPTEGTSISLIFTKIQLTPEMFGGKKEVRKDEIIKVLGKMYPEYSPGRTTIEYDKENKLVVPILKGATKGCDIPGFNPLLSYEKWEEWKNDTEYHLFRTAKDGIIYQAEITPVSSVLAPMYQEGMGRKGKFLWKIEEIPFTILYSIKEFFFWVYQKYGTEVLVHLWYHPQKGYSVTLPMQWVSISSVNAEMTDCEMESKESILVADIHSHGRYRAFYSATDNKDEQGNRLYGVFGGFDALENRSHCLRTGSRGCFVSLDYSDVVNGEFNLEEANGIIERLKKDSFVCLKGVSGL